MIINNKLISDRTIIKNNDRLKLCFKVNIFNKSSVMIELLDIDSVFSKNTIKIKNGEILYSNKGNSFKIIKSEKLSCDINNLYLPTKLSDNKENNKCQIHYCNDLNRKVLLKMISKNIFKFINSGAFGYNKHKIKYNRNFWFYF